METPVIVALDQHRVDDARRCVTALHGQCGRFKVGSALFGRAGPSFVRDLVDSGHRVFLDLKFHDTPNTVFAATRSAADLEVEMLTIHASGGEAMVEAARSGVGDEESRPKLLAVTVLTSLSLADHERVFGAGGRGLGETVIALAQLAIASGADGCVCAASEVSALRQRLGPEPLLVVPGIRPAWSTSSHRGQSRTATPIEAVNAGASHLVVGRAVTEADDPAAAMARITTELNA